MIIGQTHKVDLAHPIDYQPGTIYKYGSVVKSQGNLYVASAFIPAVDPGPGKSTLWEQVSEAPEMPEIPSNYYTQFEAYTYYNLQGKLTNNIYLPNDQYAIRNDFSNSIEILGKRPLFYTKQTNNPSSLITNIRVTDQLHSVRIIEANAINNIYFTGNLQAGVAFKPYYQNLTIDQCYFAFDNHSIDYTGASTPRSVAFINCTFQKSGATALFGNTGNKGEIVLYNCVVFGGTEPHSGLGTDTVWINPILYGYTADTVGDTTLINPTYL